MITVATNRIAQSLAIRLVKYSRQVLESLGCFELVANSRPFVQELGDAELGDLLYIVSWLSDENEVTSVTGIPSTADSYMRVSHSI